MEFSLTQGEKKALLKVARETIELWVRDSQRSKLPGATGNLAAEAGAFVTIHKHGRLRGCIGNMVGSGPLVELVQNMAIASSSEDPRFDCVTPEELKEIDIEISVLSPLKKITDVEEIEVGRHGITLGKGWNRGVLLPQVATEQGWGREELLANTCLKAGLPPDAWMDPNTTIEIFSAEVFGEKNIEA